MTTDKTLVAKYKRSMLIGQLTCKTMRSNLVMTRNPVRAIASALSMLCESCCDNRYGHLLSYRQIDGKYYWHPHIPGYPSAAFNRFFNHWTDRCLGLTHDPQLLAAYVVITKACPLNCEHCFEYDAHACHDSRSEEEVLDSISRLVSLGAIRISLTGGEPLSRLPLIHCILERFQKKEVQFWINTSAAGLTAAGIKTLKQYGLTGITFSLDHYDEYTHDHFRGREGSYKQVVSSAKTAAQQGLVTELSLCATNDFVSAINLAAYMRMASELGATFVQIIEPRSLGKYEGRDVALKPEKRELLESFFLRASMSRKGTAEPLISYPDYHNRSYGCDGGKYHIYVDVQGNAFPCPFCKTVSAPLNRLTHDSLSQVLHCPHAAAPGA